jgi:iron complex outermembrane recepter protein
MIRFRFAVPLVVALLALTSSAWAQGASVTGRVADAQGGVVVNAAVTLSADVARARTTRTTADGTFSFDQVAPGAYTVQVDSPGFIPWRQRVTVTAAGAELSVMLQVAGVSEDVSVTASTPTTLTRPTTTGTRLGLTVLETPASVQVISGEAIRDRGDASVADAKTRAAGVTTQASPGNGGAGLIARGFAGVGSVMQLYDGAQFFIASGTVTFPFDTWTVDRIEVLGGPGSVLYGNGAIGGVVNVVPRKPNPYAFEHGLRIAAGSYNTFRGAIDSSGPLGDRTSYRVDLSHNRSDGFMERGNFNSTAFSGTLRHQVSDTVAVSVSEDYGHQEPQTYFGVPTIDGRLDESQRKVNYNVADAHVDYKDSWTQFKAEWQPSPRFRLRSGVHALTTNRFWRDVENYNYVPATGVVRRSSYIDIEHHQQQYGNRTDAVLNGSLFGRVNTLSAGLDYNWIRFEHVNNGPFGGTSDVPLGNPTPGTFINLAGTTPRFRTHSQQVAAFAEDRLVLTNHLSLVGGLRFDRHDVERLDLVTTTTSERTFNPASGRAGVVYAVTPGLSLYGQYATATDAIGNVISQSVAQQLFDLTTGRQLEAGVKQSVMNGRAEWTVATYRIVKKKLLAPDPVTPSLSIQIGQQSSNGVEATAALTLGPVRVDANGTLLDARFDDFAEVVSGAAVSRVGNTPPNVPERAANLWATWDVVRNWQARGGLRYVGSRYWNNANTSKGPSYTVVDAGLRRKLTDTTALDFRVFNLFDEVYAQTFIGASSAPQWILGVPRSVELALTANF